jgi:hypothetical protein
MKAGAALITGPAPLSAPSWLFHVSNLLTTTILSLNQPGMIEKVKGTCACDGG